MVATNSAARHMQWQPRTLGQLGVLSMERHLAPPTVGYEVQAIRQWCTDYLPFDVLEEAVQEDQCVPPVPNTTLMHSRTTHSDTVACWLAGPCSDYRVKCQNRGQPFMGSCCCTLGTGSRALLATATGALLNTVALRDLAAVTAHAGDPTGAPRSPKPLATLCVGTPIQQLASPRSYGHHGRASTALSRVQGGSPVALLAVRTIAHVTVLAVHDAPGQASPLLDTLACIQFTACRPVHVAINPHLGCGIEVAILTDTGQVQVWEPQRGLRVAAKAGDAASHDACRGQCVWGAHPRVVYVARAQYLSAVDLRAAAATSTMRHVYTAPDACGALCTLAANARCVVCG